MGAKMGGATNTLRLALSLVGSKIVKKKKKIPRKIQKQNKKTFPVSVIVTGLTIHQICGCITGINHCLYFRMAASFEEINIAYKT